MAQKPAVQEKVTFYAINLDGTLKKNMGCISWKYGKGFRDELHKQIDYTDQHLDIYFEEGQFVTEHPDQIAYLRAYNTGGMITLQNGRAEKVPANGQFFRITEEDPTIKGIKVVEKTTEVRVNTIPKSVLSLMDLQARVDFCNAEGIELPSEVTLGSVEQVMQESGRII